MSFSENSHGEVIIVLDCDILVSEFEFQPLYYDHFQNNTLKKGMNALIPSAID